MSVLTLVVDDKNFHQPSTELSITDDNSEFEKNSLPIN